jgi:hypothetical protein
MAVDRGGVMEIPMFQRETWLQGNPAARLAGIKHQCNRNRAYGRAASEKNWT